MAETRQSSPSNRLDTVVDLFVETAKANFEVATQTWSSAFRCAKKRVEAGTRTQEECARAVWRWMNSISRVEQDFVHSAADMLGQTLKLSLDLLDSPLREKVEEFNSAMEEGIRDFLGASFLPFVSTQDEA